MLQLPVPHEPPSRVWVWYGKRKLLKYRDFVVERNNRKWGSVTIGHPRGGFCHAGRAKRGEGGDATYRKRR